MKRPDGQKARNERRIDARVKIRKVGRIRTPDTHKIYACIILDLSTTGALVLVHDKVPDTFDLFYVAERTLRRSVVVRRQQDMLGVRFAGDPEILAPDDERLVELRG